MFGFRLPTRVTLEPGSSRRSAEALEALGAAKTLVVVDPGLASTPWPERLVHDLAGAGIETTIFDDVAANPRTASAERAAELARDGGFEAIVGLGGGSVLDAAKAAAMLATNPGRAGDYEGRNRFSEAPLPFIAIPTTCGTGSEVTWVSVLTDEESRRKISLKGDGMFPDFALVDADLVASLPPALIASTGLDALTHALEALTSKASNPVSDALASEAARLLLGHLEGAVAGVSEDGVARDRAAVVRASTLAGIAFGNADVGAVHCLSETLGGFYDVPHGLANAILLVPVLRHQLPANHGRLAALAETVLDERPSSEERGLAEALLAQIEGLVARLGISSFADLGIPDSDDTEIAEAATRNGSNDSNPMPMRTADYHEILMRLRGAEAG